MEIVVSHSKCEACDKLCCVQCGEESGYLVSWQGCYRVAWWAYVDTNNFSSTFQRPAAVNSSQRRANHNELGVHPRLGLSTMSAPALQARLNYLTDAAHLLAPAVPDASAFLMTRRQTLTARQDVPISDVEKQHVCTACGTILILGCNSALKIESDRALRQRRQGRLSAGLTRQGERQETGRLTMRTGATKTVSCGRCGRETTVQLPPPPSVGRQKKARAGPKGGAATRTPDVPKPSANAGSKKRAKNRKAGLQALLAESTTSASKSGSGLTLANFMKK